MPYRFTFDLTRVSKKLFTEIMMIADNIGLHRKVGKYARLLTKKLHIQEITGLNLSDVIQLIEDFIEIQIKNIKYRNDFIHTKKRALLLPHCARKYMDNRCKAYFNPSIPSYICRRCSEDCLIRQATELGEARGYDVYVLPGGSCIKEIIESGEYEAVVGVACGMEIKLADMLLQDLKIPRQAVPLVKNGCAYTVFNMDYLKSLL